MLHQAAVHCSVSYMFSYESLATEHESTIDCGAPGATEAFWFIRLQHIRPCTCLRLWQKKTTGLQRCAFGRSSLVTMHSVRCSPRRSKAIIGLSRDALCGGAALEVTSAASDASAAQALTQRLKLTPVVFLPLSIRSPFAVYLFALEVPDGLLYQ